jgi:hypothetical protein
MDWPRFGSGPRVHRNVVQALRAIVGDLFDAVLRDETADLQERLPLAFLKLAIFRLDHFACSCFCGRSSITANVLVEPTRQPKR